MAKNSFSKVSMKAWKFCLQNIDNGYESWWNGGHIRAGQKRRCTAWTWAWNRTWKLKNKQISDSKEISATVVGVCDGCVVGALVGAAVGSEVGVLVGEVLGKLVGDIVGHSREEQRTLPSEHWNGCPMNALSTLNDIQFVEFKGIWLSPALFDTKIIGSLGALKTHCASSPKKVVYLFTNFFSIVYIPKYVE